jgi:hypothetical protein
VQQYIAPRWKPVKWIRTDRYWPEATFVAMSRDYAFSLKLRLDTQPRVDLDIQCDKVGTAQGL